MLSEAEIGRIGERREYVSAGPVLRSFHESDAQIRCVLGPFGSGKSVACVMETLRMGAQEPVHNGRRRSRGAVIRNTYGELKSTTIKTWEQWVDTRIVYDHPIHGTVEALLEDGTILEMEVFFVALDRPDHTKKLLSMELTWVWVNEARQVPLEIVNTAFDRTGRYPSKHQGGFRKRWMILDSNCAEEGSWLHRYATELKPESWAFFHQPGGLLKRQMPGGEVKYYPNPAAENIENLTQGYDYYMDMVRAGHDSDHLSVYVLGQWGSIFTGRPVYGEAFIEQMHVSREPLGAYRGLPFYFGWDFGLTPAGILFQVSPRGQVRILREYCCEDGGVRQFCTRVVLPALVREFGQITMRSWGDPAGKERAQGDSDITPIGELNKLGFNCTAAPSNLFEIRREAVLNALRRLIDGGAGLVIDPSCKMVIKGFKGGYKFSRVPSPDGRERYRDVPDKDEYSHPHDALQYGLLGAMTPEGNVSQRAQSAELPKAGGGWGGV